MSVRVTAIVNLKGGVAKTTTTINMAAILAADYRKRVLIIDADSQCNTTEFFGVRQASGNLARVLRDAGNYENPGLFGAGFIRKTEYPGIDLLPADDALMDMDLSKVESGAINSNVLRYLVEYVRNRYDYIIIDCPPAFNAASAAALVAADDVIIPIKLDAFSLRGMSNITRQIRNMRRINPRLELAGILPTMWYKDPQIVAAEYQLRDAGLRVFHHIRRSNKVDAMTFAQDPLNSSSTHSAACVDYRRFVTEYVKGR